jgi:hypothetical protein
MVYVSRKKATEIVYKCLDEMYKSSDPPISFKECEEKYVGVERWYELHRIDVESYEKIHKKYKKMLPKIYHNSLAMELLNYAPRFKEKGE